MNGTSAHAGASGNTARSPRLGLCLAGAVLAGLPLAGASQGTGAWPSRPVTIVSPYNPGGTNDVPARILADGYQRMFGQSFIIKNVPGAAGIVGSSQVMAAPADGYTLLSTNNGAMVVQAVVKSPPPYDPVKNFTPVAKAVDAYAFVGVPGDLPVKSVGDLIALARQSPGQLNFSSAGIGSYGHFLGEYFKLLTGTDIVHIPGKGSAGAVLEMKAGRIQLMFDPLVLPQAADGRIKVLAVVARARLPSLPQIPTMKESGGPEIALTGWFGLFGPANLPQEVVARLEAATEKILADPETRKKLQELGLPVALQTGAAFRARVEEDYRLLFDVKTRARMSVE
jgi:tripartite-type tricarboxylate transporter receptor subunit TctC